MRGNKLICFEKWVREQCPNQLPTPKTKYIKTNHEHSGGMKPHTATTKRQPPTVLRLEKGHFNFLVSVKKNDIHKILIIEKWYKAECCPTDGIRIKQTEQCVGIKTVVDLSTRLTGSEICCYFYTYDWLKIYDGLYIN